VVPPEFMNTGFAAAQWIFRFQRTSPIVSLGTPVAA
jgi:hypothetical protein